MTPESVWDYPRPPRVEACARRAAVEFGGEVVADSDGAVRVLETSQAPAIYFPPEDVRMELLEPVAKRTFCEWKGVASYYDVVVGDRRSEAAAWTYPTPVERLRRADRLPRVLSPAGRPLHARRRCRGAQRGDFYGGWITPDIQGPFKGAPGTASW